ncbi:MAG TPA: hypothetical protein VGI19_12245 [Candidatus Cybelea sp.]
MNEDLILMPEVQARRTLGLRHLRLQVLRPAGAWIGCGLLRVLRLNVADDGSADVTAGYESYYQL